MRLESSHLHVIIVLLPTDQHLPTPDGSLPYDHDLMFPAITSDTIPGTPIGNVSIRSDYELGYLIQYEHWGKGYAAEAVAGILREIWRGSEMAKFGTLLREEGGPADGREYVAARTHTGNDRSTRVLLKNGFCLSGTKDVEDISQTKEDKEKNGVKMCPWNYWKKYKPEL